MEHEKIRTLHKLLDVCAMHALNLMLFPQIQTHNTHTLTPIHICIYVLGYNKQNKNGNTLVTYANQTRTTMTTNNQLYSRATLEKKN